MGCTETSAIKYETDKFLFEIFLCEHALLYKIPVPSNPPDDNENSMGNIIMEETKEDGLDGKKGSGGTECCLSKIEMLAVLPEWLCYKVPILGLVTGEHLIGQGCETPSTVHKRI